MSSNLHSSDEDAVVSYSVITITRNNLAGLRRTAASVARQTFAGLEWIVIDGASTDGTREWLEHEQPSQWVSEPDKGIYHAMNKGIARARGGYLLFLNAGDAFAADDMLATIDERLHGCHSRPVFVYGDAVEVDADGKRYYRRARSHRLVWLSMFTHHQAMLFESSTSRRLLYDESYRLSGDYAFVASFLRGSPPTLRLPFAVCEFELGGAHAEQRSEGLVEDRRVREEILKLPRGVARALDVYHRLNAAARRRVPAWSRRVRARPLR